MHKTQPAAWSQFICHRDSFNSVWATNGANKMAEKPLNDRRLHDIIKIFSFLQFVSYFLLEQVFK